MTVTRDEFYKIYKEKFEPVLLPLEPGRKALAKKGAMLLIIGIIINAVAFLLSDYISILPFLSMGLSVVAIFWYKKNMDKYRAELKKSVMSKILSLFGNIYFSGKRNLIRLNTIKNFGLFRSASAKTDDDIVIGLYNGCNFLINECLMTHSEGSGKHSRIVTDFRGFIFQVSMNKPFSGRTIVGVNGDIDKLPGFEEVKLESVEFMKGRKIYAVGTTSTRTLETIMHKYHEFRECSGNTDIFIYPGFKFMAIDGLITNFHLPKSTLLMLVSALSSKEIILNAYREAVKEKYRFFSFGDAMFIK